jgi:hypothetical protein
MKITKNKRRLNPRYFLHENAGTEETSKLLREDTEDMDKAIGAIIDASKPNWTEPSVENRGIQLKTRALDLRQKLEEFFDDKIQFGKWWFDRHEPASIRFRDESGEWGIWLEGKYIGDYRREPDAEEEELRDAEGWDL